MAGNRIAVLTLLAVLFVLFTGCKGERCTTGRQYVWLEGYRYVTKYCTYGCCGTYPYEYCCAKTPTTWLIWVIVGAVLGGIGLISLIILAICCCVKRQGSRGQVIQHTATPIANPAFSTTTNMAYPGTGAQYPAGAAPPPNYPYPPPPATAAAVTPEPKGQ
ncbi:uncharacterized protein LOC143285186 [Babylonia areolata]|uniref:uncharacterized protein LOC143285186 n=1 Tax=Babylonia areolata TaxID=304850 RepID=UPI003FD440F7